MQTHFSLKKMLILSKINGSVLRYREKKIPIGLSVYQLALNNIKAI